MIRTFHTSDTDKIMQLWLKGNEDAHPFIKKEYWQTHFPAVREQILDAEIFVYEENDKILGFIGIMEESRLANCFAICSLKADCFAALGTGFVYPVPHKISPVYS